MSLNIPPLKDPRELGLVEEYLYELCGDHPATAEAFAQRNPAHESLLARIRALHGRMEAALSKLAGASSDVESASEARGSVMGTRPRHQVFRTLDRWKHGP